MSDRDRKRNTVLCRGFASGYPVMCGAGVWKKGQGTKGNRFFVCRLGLEYDCFAALACCVGNRDFAAVAILFGAVDGKKFCERLIVSSLSGFTAPNLRQIWGRLTLVLVQYYCCLFSCKPDSRSRWWGVGGGGGEHGFFILFFLAVFPVLILLRSLASRSFQSFGFCVCRCVCACVFVFVSESLCCHAHGEYMQTVLENSLNSNCLHFLLRLSQLKRVNCNLL